MEKILKYSGLVALVLVLVFVLAGYVGKGPVAPLGAAVDNLQKTGVTAYEDVAAGDAAMRYVNFNLAQATSTHILINRAPFTRWIKDSSLVSLTGNATDTPYMLHIGTTTSIRLNGTAAGNGQDVPLYVAPPFAGLVSNYKIATSTVASSTPLSHLSRSGNGYQGAFPWKAGEGLFMVLQVDQGTAGRNTICPTQTGTLMCSAATSTDRGFDIEVLLDTYSTSTVR